jgi:hypothetical protein
MGATSAALPGGATPCLATTLKKKAVPQERQDVGAGLLPEPQKRVSMVATVTRHGSTAEAALPDKPGYLT